MGAVFSPSISRQDACFCYSPRPFPCYKLPRERFSPSARRYSTREQILIRNHYDPNVDIVRRRDGLIELAGKKPRLRDDTRAYFAERNEGTVDFYP